ncbi:MAG: VWA domain-containing protein, partial [Opitutaceae bacterium]|nr:VWA domain-containing protein [Opitutaceae bacterium]
MNIDLEMKNQPQPAGAEVSKRGLSKYSKQGLRILISLLGILCISPMYGAGLLKPADSSLRSLEIRDHQAKVTINNGFARTEIIQTFYNPNQQALEALYTFPLPEHASLSEMTIWIGERELQGEVVKKAKAEQMYEEESSNGNDAGLAQKDTYQRYEFWVNPVPALGEARIRVVYYQPLEIDTGIGTYVYPLEEGGTDDAAEQFWNRNEVVSGTFSIDVEIKSAWPLKGLRTPGFQGTQSTDEEGDYVYTFQSNGGSLTKDFVLYYMLEDNLPGRVEVIPYREGSGKPGTFMMVITPGVDLQPLTGGSDYVFVLDISGSMKGKLHTLVEGVKQTIGSLKPEDRFRIILFNNEARELTRSWTPATSDQVSYALSVLDGVESGGGTNLFSGLKRALRGIDDDRATSIIFVTDGVTNTGELSPTAFAHLMTRKDIRVFGFLLGSSANWPLMKTICDASGGFYKGVSNSDDIIGQILLAKSKVLYESMHDVELSIRGVNTFDLSPMKFQKV